MRDPWIKVGRFTFLADEVVCVADSETVGTFQSQITGLRVVIRCGYVMEMDMKERAIFLRYFTVRQINDLATIPVQSVAVTTNDDTVVRTADNPQSGE
jgi:hypothetical protein